jgi:hypothetical protein
MSFLLPFPLSSKKLAISAHFPDHYTFQFRYDLLYLFIALLLVEWPVRTRINIFGNISRRCIKALHMRREREKEKERETETEKGRYWLIILAPALLRRAKTDIHTLTLRWVTYHELACTFIEHLPTDRAAAILFRLCGQTELQLFFFVLWRHWVMRGSGRPSETLLGLRSKKTPPKALR